MPADPRPRLRLWHLTESRFSARSPEFATHTSAFTVRRPGGGYAQTTVRCPRCSAELRLRVASADGLRRLLRRWATGFAAGVLALAAGVVLLLTTPVVWLPVVLLVAGFLTVVGTGFGWAWATAVAPLRAPGPHHVRPDQSHR